MEGARTYIIVSCMIRGMTGTAFLLLEERREREPNDDEGRTDRTGGQISSLALADRLTKQESELRMDGCAPRFSIFTCGEATQVNG